MKATWQPGETLTAGKNKNGFVYLHMPSQMWLCCMVIDGYTTWQHTKSLSKASVMSKFPDALRSADYEAVVATETKTITAYMPEADL